MVGGGEREEFPGRNAKSGTPCTAGRVLGSGMGTRDQNTWPEGPRAEYPREQNWLPHGLTGGSAGAGHRDDKVSTLSRPFQPSALLSHLHRAGTSALTGKAIPTPK